LRKLATALLVLIALTGIAAAQEKNEVFVTAGPAFTRSNTEGVQTKLNVGVGYGYKFDKPYTKYVFDEVTASYGYTDLGGGYLLTKGHPGAHSALFGVKRNMVNDIDRFGLFVTLEAGPTVFTGVTNVTKFTGAFGAGVVCRISDEHKLDLTVAGKGFKTVGVPIYSGIVVGLSKSF